MPTLQQISVQAQTTQLTLLAPQMPESMADSINSDFLKAVKDGNLEEAKKQWESLKAENTLIISPLLVASYYGHSKIVEWCLQHECVETQDLCGNTALTLASSRGHLDCVAVLLEHKANVNHVNREQYSALALALWYGHIEIASLLMKQPGIDKHKATITGYTPFLLALNSGYEPLAEQLHKEKNTLDAHYADLNTALHYFVNEKSLKPCVWLLNRGANPHVLNKNSQAPLTVAVQSGFAEIIPVLFKHYSNQKEKGHDYILALYLAAKLNKVDCLKQLLAQKVRVWPSVKHFALMVAVEHSNQEAVDMLLDHFKSENKSLINHHHHYTKFNALFPHNNGDTLLHVAVLNGNVAMAQSLISRGANMDATNRSGMTVLHCAVESRNREMLTWLCKQKLSIDKVMSSSKDSPLLLAIRTGWAEGVECLLEHGAKLDENGLHDIPMNAEVKNVIKDFKENNSENKSYTRLHQAAIMDNEVMMSNLLIYKEVPLKEKAKYEITPIMAAAYRGYHNMVAMLLLWEAKGSIKEAETLAKDYKSQHTEDSTAAEAFKNAIKDLHSMPPSKIEALKEHCTKAQKESCHVKFSMFGPGFLPRCPIPGVVVRGGVPADSIEVAAAVPALKSA